MPHEQEPNPYLDRWITCRHFFVRKVLLFKYSYAFVGLPGGIGTLDELFEALTLIQTGKIEHFPIILIGAEYWRPLHQLLRHLAAAGTIAASDMNLLLITDSVDEAIAYLRRHAIEQFGLRPAQPKPSILLGEKRRLASRPAA